MTYCPNCGKEISSEDKFCAFCGTSLLTSPTSHLSPSSVTPTFKAKAGEFIVVTTPSIPGHEVTKVMGIVTGITVRTRGVGGKIVAAFQSLLGGEVSAFTYEMEKARMEAVQRLVERAKQLKANAVIGLDLETTETFENVVMVSATGTAVQIRPLSRKSAKTES